MPTSIRCRLKAISKGPELSLEHLQSLTAKRSAHPFGYKMYRHLRPYQLEASQAMIPEGQPREAMAWTLAFYVSSLQIIQRDAPAQLTAAHQAAFDACIRQLNLKGAEDWNRRIAQVRNAWEQIFALADACIARHPQIMGSETYRSAAWWCNRSIRRRKDGCRNCPVGTDLSCPHGGAARCWRGADTINRSLPDGRAFAFYYEHSDCSI